MALEDRLLKNFRCLPPDQRQLLVEFSESLLKQTSRMQEGSVMAKEQSLSPSERQRRMALMNYSRQAVAMP
jgi:hypothetical protein